MLETAHLTDVVRFILESDDSYYNNPKRLISGFRDLYTGNQSIADDFINVISELSPLIKNGYAGLNDILKVIPANSELTVFAPILKTIYIYHRSSDLSRYELLLQNKYCDTKIKNTEKRIEHNYSIESSIEYFRCSHMREIIYGEIINLEWNCINPLIVSIAAGNVRMDVSKMSSLGISALFDSYDLILLDYVGNILDKKTINIKFRETTYCLNCGQLIWDRNDRFCTICGVKVCYEK